MFPRLVTHILETFTYLLVLQKYLHLSSLSKQKFFCWSFVISNREKIGTHSWFGDYDFSSLPKFVRTLSAECRTDLNPLVTASSKRSTEEFLFAESRQMNVLYVNASYEWVTNRGIIPGKCCPIFLAQTDHQKWGIFTMVTCLQTTQHKTNQNLPKNSYKLADFRQTLQCNCGLW